MCLNHPWAKKREIIKKGWPRMVQTHDLPTPPIMQKEAFLAKKREFMIYLFWPTKNKGRS